MVAILYNIRSLHNVGSMFRTADAAGIEKLYLCGITPAPVDEFGKTRKDISKTALGAERFVKWKKENVKRTGKLILELKEEGYLICAIEQSKESIPYNELKKIKKYRNKEINKIALIVGNEVKGLPKSILKKADKILEIPMYGKKESLNVSVAFGIVVYEIIRK